MNILYVEDDPKDADLVARYLQSVGHQVLVVTHPDMAWESLKDVHIAMVDILIGGERVGFQFAKALRNQGYTQPLIAVTALATPKDREDCLNAGFDTIVTKPFTINELAEMLNEFIL